MALVFFTPYTLSTTGAGGGATTNEYPPFAMTANTTSSYTASASVSLGASYAAYYAFDKQTPTGSDKGWLGGSYGLYNVNAGSYGQYTGSTNTTISGTSIAGEWIQLQLQNSIVISGYSICATDNYNRTPYTWYLAGSSDGSTWTLIDNKTAVSFVAQQVKTFNLASTPASYNYYRLVASATQNTVTDGYVSINELKFFSTTSPYLLDSLTSDAITNLRGVWSMSVLFAAAASQPIVTLQNSAGTVTQDFYGNIIGTTLTTAANGGGTTLSAWKTANSITTVYISKWYDQSYYARGSGTAYDATASGAQRPTLSTTSAPYYVDGTASGYFNLSLGTIVGNSSYTFSAKVNQGSSTVGGIIGAGGAANNSCNALRWDGANGFMNYWLGSAAHDVTFSLASVSKPAIVTVITYNTGNAPTASAGTTFSGGTSSTNYTTTTFINKTASTTKGSFTSGGWVFNPSTNTLMNVSSGGALTSNMYWCINSSQAMCANDRAIIENIP